jgi:Spy/CpxP family protein refolding chaperone
MSVTTAGISRSRPSPQRPRALVAALAISVALNLCVVAGAAWNRLHAPSPPPTLSEHYHRVADTLGLTPEQRIAFDRYVADMTARGERMRQSVEPAMDSAWTELAKPDADQARVLQLLDDASNRRRAFMHDAVGATMSLLATLSPEQRAKFLTDERAYRAAQRRRHADESR